MRMCCTPDTFVLSFGKEGKQLSDLLIQVLEDYLKDIDFTNLRGIGPDGVKMIANALYDLKSAPCTAYTPRCHVKLWMLYEFANIARKYAEKEKKQQARFLAAYLDDIYKKMKDIKWQ